MYLCFIINNFGMLSYLKRFLFNPINPSIVCLYRIIFGCFMLYQVIVYYKMDYTYQFMAGPQVLFPYNGLEFIIPVQIEILKVIHFILLISTIFIIVGYRYRLASLVFFLGFTYFYLVDVTLYNNHFYLISLISLALIFINADVKYSIKSKKNISQNIRIPAWNQHILIFLVSLPYFFGAIAKLSDNWLKTDLTLLIFENVRDTILNVLIPDDLFLILIKYGSIIYDFSIVFLLLNKKTRKIGVILLLIFNLMNGNILFDDIGLFPLLMIFSTILFFDPENINNYIIKLLPSKNQNKILNKREIKLLKRKEKNNLLEQKNYNYLNRISWNNKEKITTLFLALFFLFHVLFPLRHFLLTNNPEWTGLGSHFSWRMKMQAKEITNFNVYAINRNTNYRVNIDVRSYLSKNQIKHIADDPRNLIHLAKYFYPLIEKNYRFKDPKVIIELDVKFNGFKSQNYISPSTDLVRLDTNPFSNKNWILPLKKI